jgi:hypothetical protein
MKLSSMTVEGPIEVRSCKEMLTKSKDHEKKVSLGARLRSLQSA